MSEPKVVLYVTDGCGLCDQARALLTRERIAFEEATDLRYSSRVPVVEIAGSVVSEGRIRPLVLRRAMRRARRS